MSKHHIDATLDSAALKRFYLSKTIVQELVEHRKWAERILFFAGIVSAGMAIPHVLTIYHAKDSSQVSLIAWSYYIFVNLLWIIYAYAFKRPVVKRVQFMYIISNAAVLGMALYFRFW